MTSDNDWKPVPGAPGYEAHPDGLVRSLRRGEPVVRQATPGPCGFNTILVTGHESGKLHHRVGTFVAASFIGPRPAGSEVRRLDGNPLNDRLENLAYGTREDVSRDHRARAEREERTGAPTHCPKGHKYEPSWLGNWGERFCHECSVEHLQRLRAKHPRPKQPRANCLECGKQVDRDQAKRCTPCAKIHVLAYHRQWGRENRAAIREARPARSFTCHGCGITEPLPKGRKGPLPTRCPECKRVAHREADQRFRDRKRAAKLTQPKESRSFTCHGCGVNSTLPDGRTGPLPKWCPECKRVAHREADQRFRNRQKVPK